MHEMIGKEVEVNTADVLYRGILIEVSEHEILLQSQSGWISVPIDKVADVRIAD